MSLPSQRSYTPRGIIEKLLLYKDLDEPTLSITWRKRDLTNIAVGEFGTLLSNREVFEIFAILEDEHDATIGINLDVIREAIGRMVSKRKLSKE